MAAPLVKLSPALSARHEAGQTSITVFQVFGVTRPRFEPSLSATVVRALLPYWVKSLAKTNVANQRMQLRYFSQPRLSQLKEHLAFGAVFYLN